MFNWLIEQMDCAVQQDGKADVVLTAAWRCNGEQVDGDKTYTGTIYGSSSFNYRGKDFIPYESLTEDQVLGWCWNNGVGKEATEAAVQAQIDALIDPTVVVLPLPWSN